MPPANYMGVGDACGISVAADDSEDFEINLEGLGV